MLYSQPHPDGYAYTLAARPDFGFAQVQLKAGQMIKAEASAMATMDTNIKTKTRLKGGFGRILSGESLFINEFTAEGGPGEIGFAPGLPGDIEHIYLENETIYLQNSGYVASSPEINVETKWQGLAKGFFAKDGLFLIKYIVDNAYMVAFTEGLDYEIRKIGGLKSLFLSGEGLVCHFRGQGKLWIQTRQIPAFSSWVYPYRPTKKSND